MSAFCTLIDIAALNGFSLFIQNFPVWNTKRSNRRRLYLQELDLELVRPQVENRLKNTIGLQNNILMAMEGVLDRKIQPPKMSDAAIKGNGKGRRHACSNAARSKREKLNKLSKNNNYMCQM